MGNRFNVGDIIFHHESFGLITKISDNSNSITYDILYSDGSVDRVSITDNTPREYRLFPTNKSLEVSYILDKLQHCYIEK